LRLAWRSFGFRLFLLLTAVTMVVSLGTATAIYNVARARQITSTRAELKALAATAGPLVDGDTLATLVDPKQQDSDGYRAILRTLMRIKRDNPFILFIYTMARTPETERTGLVRFVVDAEAEDRNGNGRIDLSEEQAPLGKLYNARELAPDLLLGFTRPTADRRVTSDQWGLTLSGYAPIYDRSGRVAGLLGIDMAAERLTQMEREFGWSCLLIVIGVTLVSALIAYGASALVERPLAALVGAIAAVRLGRRDVVIDGGSTAELREVAQAFNEMVRAQQQIEEQLQQSAKLELLGQLARNLAHDLNNVLAVVSGSAAVLGSSLDPNDTRQTHVRQIGASVRNAVGMIERLLAFAHDRRQAFSETDVRAVVADSVAVLRPSLNRSIQIESHFDDGDLKVRGDGLQLQNALLNLGLNARDAMPDGGVLSFAVRQITLSDAERNETGCTAPAGPFVRIDVIDVGCGMDGETRRRIFEPFFTTKPPGKGTGLGLASVLGIVRQHAGGVTVESEPGQGARFSIYLPRLAEEGGRAPLP
jgi:signal transduction histidine kinase